jgi:Kef-type K+ transport system membrane component KefB
MGKVGRFVTDPKAGAYCRVTLDSGEKILVNHDRGETAGGSVIIEEIRWWGLASGETLLPVRPRARGRSANAGAPDPGDAPARARTTPLGVFVDLRAFARVGLSSLLVALTGVVVPFGLGWAAAAWLLPNDATLVHIFVGAILTATSVGITARVLKDLGVTQSPEGQTILGAAILDDVLGLIVLAIVGGMVAAAATGGPGLSALAIAGIFIRAVLFLGITVGLGHWLSGPIVRLAARTGQHGMLLVVGLALCFTLAHIAELVGLADIVGAFAAGLLLDPYGTGVRAREDEATLAELLHPLSTLFVPLFFVLMGIQVHLGSLADATVLRFGTVLVLCAVAGKLACGLGVVGRGMNRLAVAVGMIPRGEVGLIFAGIGTSLTLQSKPLLSQGVFSAVVLMVLITTLVTPVGLRWAVRRSGGAAR